MKISSGKNAYTADLATNERIFLTNKWQRNIVAKGEKKKRNIVAKGR